MTLYKVPNLNIHLLIEEKGLTSNGNRRLKITPFQWIGFFTLAGGEYQEASNICTFIKNEMGGRISRDGESITISGMDYSNFIIEFNKKIK